MKKLTPTPVTVDTLYCNGASLVWGQELGNESEDYRSTHAFPGLVAKHYNLALINSALPGASNHRIVRTTVNDVSNLLLKNKQPLVVIAWSLPHRFELFSKEINDWVNFANVDKDAISNKIWTEYSTDRSDLIVFLTQVILLQSFLTKNQVPYIMLNGNEILYNILTKEEVAPYKSQIDTTYYLNELSIIQLLKMRVDVEWGQAHPLEHGHQIIADFLKTHIDIRYQLIV